MFSLKLLIFKDDMPDYNFLKLVVSSTSAPRFVAVVNSANSWDSFGWLTIQSMIKGDVIRLDIERLADMSITHSKITFNGFCYRPPSLFAAWNLEASANTPLFAITSRFTSSKSICYLRNFL